MSVTLSVNGMAHSLPDATPPDTPLLDLLRNRLGLTGTRFGCGQEQCGACTVLIDGRPTHACTVRLATVAGKRVVTVEGLAGPDGTLHPLQQAFLDEQAGQCGYCLSGILMAATALLEANPNPSRDQIAAALDGHLCRCGSHTRILRAVARAAATLRGEG